MESFEFLGGRYNRPEQIMSGPVQAFRAQSATNGRTVFIHRVSTTESPGEQAGLLKLLTTALVKSADVKRLVLDFGEEGDYWYVVTECEPQCALLREWLQLEIEAAASGSRLNSSATPSSVTKTPPATARETETDTGEFTRFLKARPPANSPASTPRFIPPTPSTPPPLSSPAASPQRPVPPPPAAKQEQPAGEFTRLFQSPSTSPADPPARPPSELAETMVHPAFTGQPAPFNPPATPPQPPAAPEVQRPNPGEFTVFFNASDEARKQARVPQNAPPPRPVAPQPPAPSASGPMQPEAGEFTRFFKPGLPPAAPKPSPQNPQGINLERSNSPYVQRPNTPVPPPKPVEKGEFTQLFSRPDNAHHPSPNPAANPSAGFQPPPAVRSDPFGFAKQPSSGSDDLHDRLFSDKLDAPKPIPSSQPNESEFTRLFGSSGAAPPPLQQPAVMASPKDRPLVDEHSPNTDPFRVTQPLPAYNPQPPMNEAPAGSPSEFTKIMQGGYGPSKPPASGGVTGASSSGASPSGASPAPGAGAPGGSGSKGGFAAPPINVSMTPINPVSALPHMGSAGGSVGGMHGNLGPTGASAGSALGSAHIGGPQMAMPHLAPKSVNLKVPPVSGAAVPAGNKKMVILFVVLGILAVLLILLMLFVMKNK